MPSSRYNTIPYILEIVTRLRPRSILDIGIGYGKWGVLFREYLDVWQVNKPYSEKTTEIIGIEAFAEYKNPVWEAYTDVLIGDINNHLGKFQNKTFDLLFLGDVIEHFEKEEGLRILEKVSHDNAIIVTPYQPLPQGNVYNNPYERHISSWTAEDFPDQDLNVEIIEHIQVITYGNRFINNPARKNSGIRTNSSKPVTAG